MVTPVTFRHPSVLARMVTTVDHVSGGRAELGLGMGWFEGEHRAAGIPFPPTRERAEQLAEALEIIHRQWTEDVSTSRPPLRARALPRAAEAGAEAAAADHRRRHRRSRGRSCPPFASPTSTTPTPRREDARERRALIDAACERAGRDPATLPLSVMAGLVVGATSGEVAALDGARRATARVRERGRAARSARRRVADRHAAPRWSSGSATFEAAGVSRVFLQVWGADAVPMLELAAAEVLPAL